MLGRFGGERVTLLLQNSFRLVSRGQSTSLLVAMNLADAAKRV